jgi:molybdopterin synthase sulfur carrier subunit
MARVVFTQNLQRHVSAPPGEAPGATVREVLEAIFAAHPRLRGYVLDDQQRLRTHMVVFVDGQMLRDRVGLSDAVAPDSEVYVMQALSGGSGAALRLPPA